MAIEVRIKKCFSDFKLDVAFQTGEDVFGVLGESGCGKSLTLKCIAGIETPDEGRIVLNGRVLFDSSAGINLSPGERKVGFLFQEYALFPNMTVEENIAIGAGTLAGTDGNKRRRRSEKQKLVEKYIRQFRLNGLEKKYPSALSGGQKQRVAIARMMITEPEIVLLDEPFSAIDSYLKWQIEQEILDWLEQIQVTALLVSHNRDEIYRLCERIGIIHEGQMEVCGEKREIFQKPGTVSAAILTGCKNIADVENVTERESENTESARGQRQYLVIPAWNCTLPVPGDIDGHRVQSVGIRAHDVQIYPAGSGGERRGSEGSEPMGSKKRGSLEGLTEGVVKRRIEAPFDYIYVIRPLKETAGTIRAEIPKSGQQSYEVGDRIFFRIPPECVLWLKKSDFMVKKN